jgi:hypothetical protein
MVPQRASACRQHSFDDGPYWLAGFQLWSFGLAPVIVCPVYVDSRRRCGYKVCLRSHVGFEAVRVVSSPIGRRVLFAHEEVGGLLQLYVV